MGAILSDCRKYRYQLSRDVDIFGQLTFGYFGVNPSTANENVDDATVKKWIGFTKANDGSQFIVANVFAYRATNVNDLAKTEDPIGIDNDRYIDDVITEADILVPCWGSRDKLPKSLHHRLDTILERLKASGKPVKTFGLCASGDPKHPLMLAYDTKLIPIN
jgi:hypothetical protein